jgi:hypothetical protein
MSGREPTSNQRDQMRRGGKDGRPNFLYWFQDYVDKSDNILQIFITTMIDEYGIVLYLHHFYFSLICISIMYSYLNFCTSFFCLKQDVKENKVFRSEFA